MGKRKAAQVGEVGTHLSTTEEGYLTIWCIHGQAPVSVPRTGHADPSEVETEFQAFQIGDPARAEANGSGLPSLRTVRPGDTVLVDAGEDSQGGMNTPYIALVRQVYRDVKGDPSLRVSWMYRPSEAASQGAKPLDGWRPREIMFSRHMDTIQPHHVMHPCQVHFLPYGSAEPRWIMGSTDSELHERPVPGFLCFRSWDIVRKELLVNRVGQRPSDFIDIDDQHMTVEVQPPFPWSHTGLRIPCTGVDLLALALGPQDSTAL